MAATAAREWNEMKMLEDEVPPLEALTIEEALSMVDYQEIRDKVENEVQWIEKGLSAIEEEAADARIQRQHEYVDIPQTLDEVYAPVGKKRS